MNFTILLYLLPLVVANNVVYTFCGKFFLLWIWITNDKQSGISRLEANKEGKRNDFLTETQGIKAFKLKDTEIKSYIKYYKLKALIKLCLNYKYNSSFKT